MRVYVCVRVCVHVDACSLCHTFLSFFLFLLLFLSSFLLSFFLVFLLFFFLSSFLSSFCPLFLSLFLLSFLPSFLPPPLLYSYFIGYAYCSLQDITVMVGTIARTTQCQIRCTSKSTQHHIISCTEVYCTVLYSTLLHYTLRYSSAQPIAQSFLPPMLPRLQRQKNLIGPFWAREFAVAHEDIDDIVR